MFWYFVWNWCVGIGMCRIWVFVWVTVQSLGGHWHIASALQYPFWSISFAIRYFALKQHKRRHGFGSEGKESQDICVNNGVLEGITMRGTITVWLVAEMSSTESE